MNAQIPLEGHQMPKKGTQTAFCSKHPTGYLGKDQFGNWYSTCIVGKKHNEVCEIIIEGGEKNEII